MGLAKNFWKSKTKEGFYKSKPDVSSMTWHELRGRAKDLGIQFKDMKRPELEQAVLDAIK